MKKIIISILIVVTMCGVAMADNASKNKKSGIWLMSSGVVCVIGSIIVREEARRANRKASSIQPYVQPFRSSYGSWVVLSEREQKVLIKEKERKQKLSRNLKSLSHILLVIGITAEVGGIKMYYDGEKVSAVKTIRW